MIDTAMEPASTVFIFGPQASAFHQESFARLRDQLYGPNNQWLLSAVSGLPSSWAALAKAVPNLQHLDGLPLLEQLATAIRTGNSGDLQFPLPNILLSPLVVATHLTQYLRFLRSALPHLADTDDLPSPLIHKTEVVGLCTGMLSGIAVNCSSRLEELRNHGAKAIRLAMLVGALVDAEQASPGSQGEAKSLSVAWKSVDSSTEMERILAEFPEAYMSVSVDEKRSTITASKQIIPSLVEKLRSTGFHVVEVGLSGRFHWSQHQKDVEKLIQFCDGNVQFGFPQATGVTLSHRAKAKGVHSPADSLHRIALREILTIQSQWFRTFSTTYESHMTADARVICFGQERCIPPTIARKLGSRLVQVADIDLSSIGLSIPHFFDFVDLPDDRIAVIGMSCHVPGASDLFEFWNVLASGHSQHTEVPSSRFGMETAWRDVEKGRKWYGNFIENFDTFDHKFFKKSPREMASTDPQHRIVLQLAYQAVEQSGYFGASRSLPDRHIGCYIGIGNVDYDRNIACHPANAYSATGNLRSFVAGKVSHYFGWTGPSMSIDTACSSSSVAIHNACRAILHGECTAALAGGVNVLTSPEWFHNLAGASFLSPTGQCKPFDAKGDGYCRGEGAGVIFLKKLSTAIADGDQVLGVIASSRVYQNQNCTAITVPNAVSLSELFADVVQQAKLEPEAISVVEAHGTGTPVGDPAEYDGIRRQLGGSIRSDQLSLSSVKGSIGHTEFASGVLSLLKVLLMVNEKAIPPQASFTSISPGLKATPEDNIEIPTRLKSWDSTFRAALLNNYGASGSNASMVITEAPEFGSKPASLAIASNESFPFWFCGLDDDGLRTYVSKFRKFLRSHTSTRKDMSAANLSFQVSRQSNRALPRALICNAKSSSELEQKLTAFEQSDPSIKSIQQQPSRPVILCFGGQISTFVGLDEDAYNSATLLRSHLDKCNTECLAIGLDSIYPHIFQKSTIEDTVALQTALFAMQYSSARTWIDCGVKVSAVLGHSFGELTALCVAGVYTLRDALEMIAGRARLIRDKWGSEKGSMLAVEADITDVNNLVENSVDELSIACYNGPRMFTLAGSATAIDSAYDLAKTNPKHSSMRLKKLNVTNAFHSGLVGALVDDLAALSRKITFREPTIRVERATEHPSTGKPEHSYIARHMREPVFFNHAVQRLAQDFPAAVWLEAGSNSTVTTMASRALGNPSISYFQGINATCDHSLSSIADSTAKLWKEGLDISFWAHHPKQISEYTPLLLPPYQFEKSRHWMELTSPPTVEVPVIEKAVETEKPKGLTSFMGYQDEDRRSVRFQVNTEIEKFQQSFQANVVLNTTAVAPGTLQLHIVLDALSSLRPDLKGLGFQPEIRKVSYLKAIVAETFGTLHLDVINTDAEGLVWEWTIRAAYPGGSVSDLTTGTVAFRQRSDTHVKDNFESLARLSVRKRCTDLLEGLNGADILSGRNIYRAFAQVVNYKDPYRHVTRIAAKGYESAGLISKAPEGESWIDPILAESFCQVAGMFVNMMAAESVEEDVFLCIGLDRWMRSPAHDDISALPAVWEVFAVHHQKSETKYISDIFAFNPCDGSLVEAVLGMKFHRVSMDGMRKQLSQSDHPVFLSTKDHNSRDDGRQQKLEQPLAPPVSTPTAPVVPASKKPIKKEAQSGPEISTKTKEIVCNLSGLEPEEVKDDSDLVELGIDSLMAMELVREVESAFKRTLETDQLMALTDFRSLVECIRACLGMGGDSGTDTSDESFDELSPTPPENTGDMQIQASKIDMAGGLKVVNGTNGYLTPPMVDTGLPAEIVRVIFGEVKWATDSFVVNGQLGGYVGKVMPRSTELCIVYIVDAFEKLGCPIRSAKPGQELERVQYLPKHQQFMDLIYGLMEHEARLIEVDGSIIKRTAVPAPTRPAENLLAELLRDEPVHAAEHKLTGLIGPKFADCLSGKEDCLQMMFGTPTGREIVTDMYAKSPITGIWIQQLEHFLEQLVQKLPRDGQPLCILEMGAGTGGTTSKLVPMLAKFGVPIKYTMTDISGSLVANARKRFKQYPFMKFEVLNIESEPAEKLLQSQHIILATNCVHATRNLTVSLTNIHRILRPDGFLMLLEMTEKVPWVDFIFGLVEGWWLFEDDRNYVLAPPEHWEKQVQSVGFGHVDWTEGRLPEASLQRLIIAHASGPRCERAPEPSAPSIPTSNALTNITERQAVLDGYIDKYTTGFRQPLPRTTLPPKSPRDTRCIMVTGATGSLGSHIVAYLAQLPDVDRVVCLNRLSTVPADVRQRKSLDMRGIRLSPSSAAKLSVVEADTSKSWLGLSHEKYKELLHNVTDIVHSAWPMSLTRPVRAYELQFKVFRNLVEFAREVVELQPDTFIFGFQFISSLAVVANYPQVTGNAIVPEQPTAVEYVPAAGYADAKLVCEHILQRTLYMHLDRFHPIVVRIAQISGATSNGYWNPTEYMPFLVRSSQVLKALPALSGTLSWYPVDGVAATLGELLLSASASKLFYHIDNPSRQPWDQMIQDLGRALDIPSSNIVPYKEWIDRVRGFGGTTKDNPALQLMDFFDHYFVSMSCGGLMLDTSNTMELSGTLRAMQPVGSDLVTKYVASWRESGFLDA